MTRHTLFGKTKDTSGTIDIDFSLTRDIYDKEPGRVVNQLDKIESRIKKAFQKELEELEEYWERVYGGGGE